jgi:hypothetical protein
MSMIFLTNYRGNVVADRLSGDDEGVHHGAPASWQKKLLAASAE